MSQTDRSELAPRAAAPAPTPAKPAPARSPAEIERDIEVTRERLAGSIDELTERIHPKAIANRATERARATVIDERGQPRTARLAAVGGVVATIAAIVLWRRRR